MIRIISLIILLLRFVHPAFSLSTDSEKTELIWWEVKDIGRYINKYEDPRKEVDEIRRERDLFMYDLGRPKRLLLHYGCFPVHQNKESILIKQMIIGNSRSWVKDPNSRLSVVNCSKKSGEVFIDIPDDTGLDGIYLLGSHFVIKKNDCPDGSHYVHIYPKAIVGHFNAGDIMGSTEEPFFKHPDIALEIGPVRVSRYIGNIQISHRDYTMKVLYRGKPLPHEEVTIIAERGWGKTLLTDAMGRFAVTPPETRGENRNWEKYLYVVSHHDPVRSEYHRATLLMVVDPPWPEWRSWHGALIFWTITGVGITVLIAAGFIILKKKREKTTISKFESYKIIRD